MSFPVPVAPFLHVVTPLRLGVVEAGPHTGNATEGETDRYRVRLRPLSGAYVCVVPSSFEDMKSAAEFFAVFGLPPLYFSGRTNPAGQLFWTPDWESAPSDVEVREFEHPLCSWTCDPATSYNLATIGRWDPWQQRVSSGAPGRLFWTYHADAFRDFLDALWLPTNSDGSEPSDAERSASFEAAIEKHWLFLIDENVRAPRPPLELPSLGPEERLRVQELLLVPQARTQQHLTLAQVLDNRFVASDFVDYLRAGVIYDVTPPALRALYAAEWVARCVVHLRKQSAEDWAALHRAGEVARAYSDGEPIREQELALFGSFGVPAHGGVPSAHAPGLGGGSLPVVRDPYEVQAWVEGLRGFAWSCARAGVDRDQMVRTLEDLARHVHEAVLRPPNANTALRQLATELGPRLASHAQLSTPTRNATLDYFDVYAYGKTLQDAGLRAECDAHAQGIDDAVRWVSTKAERLLSGGLPYDEFALALWTRIHDDAARDALHRRFEAVHFAFQVPFWSTSISLERWDALRPALQWMQAATSQAASVWSALIETEVHAYAKLLQDADAANQMLNFLYRHHRARAGEAIQGTAEAFHTVWTGIARQHHEFRIDFDAGIVHVLTEHGTTSSSPPVRFVQTTLPPPELQVGTALGRRLRHALLSGNGIRDQMVEFQVEVAADTRRWDTNAPTYLKAFANTLNMGLIVSALHTKAQRLDLYACVDLSQGALASVESLGAVLYALNRPHGLTPLAALQGRRAWRGGRQPAVCLGGAGWACRGRGVRAGRPARRSARVPGHGQLARAHPAGRRRGRCRGCRPPRR
ncbi:MAG: hypothetical protein IPG17_27395 [Sandaracinaceae bacterium]|nr:hypothetical protein [Sandaracinaceae bacterium]